MDIKLLQKINSILFDALCDSGELSVKLWKECQSGDKPSYLPEIRDKMDVLTKEIDEAFKYLSMEERQWQDR